MLERFFWRKCRSARFKIFIVVSEMGLFPLSYGFSNNSLDKDMLKKCLKEKKNPVIQFSEFVQQQFSYDCLRQYCSYCCCFVLQYVRLQV